MQMSAPLRRNAVCGPGCGAIFAVNGNAMPHALSVEVVRCAVGAQPVPIGRAPTLHETSVQLIEEGTISAPALSVEVTLSNADQLGVSAVVGQYEHHR